MKNKMLFGKMFLFFVFFNLKSNLCKFKKQIFYDFKNKFFFFSLLSRSPLILLFEAHLRSSMASVRFRFEACLGVSFLKYSIVVWKTETVNWQRKLQLLDSLWQYLTF
ncbi:hypothetical protein G4B88_019799 [Cannabis sativa]|uniref:Uncharacterized protein n=1 Tax=Cannabis sativa TaxID=3483 RepID=A0A7J6HTT8_CANSA|nr:hypothetical protein G4B88_019799 [Cannabis sativa]